MLAPTPTPTTNVISTEAIALHWIANVLLWSFSVLCIPYVGSSGDGQTQGTGSTPIWLYTPPQSVGRLSNTEYNSTNAVRPNVDLGTSALRETCNIAYGIATTVGATILVCRAASNTIILYPTTTMPYQDKNVSYFETCILVFGWSSTLVGMAATALGQESKTGWAVVSFEIFAIAGYVTCYVLQRTSKHNALLQEMRSSTLETSVIP